MYTLTTEASFDSAHFLHGYNGKCKNIHGHRWTVKITVSSSELEQEGHLRGMVMDFGDLKCELKALADHFDHALIIEKDTMRALTLAALKEDGFRIIELDFRPTAEKLAQYFYEHLKAKNLPLQQVTVYETPNNCASYSEDGQ